MRGLKTPPEKVEEVKALSLVYSPKAICGKVGLSLRTVYDILRRKDSPAVEAKREEMRENVVERMWKDKDKEILSLKDKLDLLLDGVDKEAIEEAKLRDRVVSYGILFDKRQLLMGKPTENINSLASIIIAATQATKEASKVIDVTPEGQGESGA